MRLKNMKWGWLRHWREAAIMREGAKRFFLIFFSSEG